jgi:hypothetical protein
MLRRATMVMLCLCITVMAPGTHSAPSASAASRHTVLILGDSVFSVLRWSPATQQPLWRRGYDIVNEAWGCQSLLTAGCPGSGGKSALQRLADHRDETIDAIVVGTGYNDVGTTTVRTGMRRIVADARSRDIPVIWATYFEGGNMLLKARAFNAALRAEATHHPNVTVVEWSAHAKGHRKWFNGDSVHLNGTGGRQLAVFLADALDDCLAENNGG